VTQRHTPARRQLLIGGPDAGAIRHHLGTRYRRSPVNTAIRASCRRASAGRIPHATTSATRSASLRGPAPRPPGKPVSAAGTRRRHDHDRADAELLRRTASSLRNDPDWGRRTGLLAHEDAYPLAALLDILTAELPHLDAAVRRQAVHSCRALLGETTTKPWRQQGTRRH
jgi:hypothetical protein